MPSTAFFPIMQDAPRIAASIRPLLVTREPVFDMNQARPFSSTPQAPTPDNKPTDIELLRATADLVKDVDQKIIKRCFGSTTHE